MKASTVNEIKKELGELSHPDLLAVTLRLARFKKENKELLTYLLFEAQNEILYIQGIKSEIDSQLSGINSSNVYLIKKSLRKIQRMTNKFIRYSGIKETEVELRIYLLTAIQNAGFKLHHSKSLINLYDNELKKTTKLITAMHEDLQFDYEEIIQKLQRK